MTTMNRRKFLAATGAMIAAPAIIGAPREARAAVTLTLGHGAAPGNPRTLAAEAFGKLVAERTGGNVAIKIAGAETLGNDVAMLTSLRTGVLDLTANSQGAASGLVPELSVLGLPFLFPNAEAAVKLLGGSVGETLAKKFEAVNIVPLDWWDNGIRHTTNSKRAITKPADLKGKTIALPQQTILEYLDAQTIEEFISRTASSKLPPKKDKRSSKT